MEPSEFNPELKEEVSKILSQLYREIGNNRQQLTNKVLGLHREINKELNASKVDAERAKGILAEVARIVKMAAQQLPHLKMNPGRPVAPSVPKPVAPKPVPQTPRVEEKQVTPKKAAPAVKTESPARKAPVAKKSAPQKKTSTPAKKNSSAKKKK